MYDIKFYNMLSDAQDETISGMHRLNRSKIELARLENGNEFGLAVSEEDIENLRDEISETYLSLSYAKTLIADLMEIIPQVRLLASFVDGRFEPETFNRLYEETLGGDDR